MSEVVKCSRDLEVRSRLSSALSPVRPGALGVSSRIHLNTLSAHAGVGACDAANARVLVSMHYGDAFVVQRGSGAICQDQEGCG